MRWRLKAGIFSVKLSVLEELLKSYGAKPLHRFPVKDLAGYVEEDSKGL